MAPSPDPQDPGVSRGPAVAGEAGVQSEAGVPTQLAQTESQTGQQSGVREPPADFVRMAAGVLDVADSVGITPETVVGMLQQGMDPELETDVGARLTAAVESVRNPETRVENPETHGRMQNPETVTQGRITAESVAARKGEIAAETTDNEKNDSKNDRTAGNEEPKHERTADGTATGTTKNEKKEKPETAEKKQDDKEQDKKKEQDKAKDEKKEEDNDKDKDKKPEDDDPNLCQCESCKKDREIARQNKLPFKVDMKTNELVFVKGKPSRAKELAGVFIDFNKNPYFRQVVVLALCAASGVSGGGKTGCSKGSRCTTPLGTPKKSGKEGETTTPKGDQNTKESSSASVGPTVLNRKHPSDSPKKSPHRLPSTPKPVHLPANILQSIYEFLIGKGQFQRWLPTEAVDMLYAGARKFLLSKRARRETVVRDGTKSTSLACALLQTTSLIFK